MNIELSKNNYIAGILYTVAVGALMTGGLRLQMDLKVQGLIAVFCWGVLFLMHMNPRKARAGGLLLTALILSGGLVPLFMRGRAWIPFNYGAQYSLSKGIADFLHLKVWPDFAFFVVDSVLEGADRLRPNGLYAFILTVMIYGLVGLVVYRLLRRPVHYSFYLLPTLLFIQQWFLYAEHIQGLFVIYFVAFVLIAGEYSRNKYHERASLEASGSQYFRNSRYGFYLLAVGFLIVLTSQVVLYLLPIESINQVVGEHIPNVMDMRTGYKRASMQLFSFEQTVYQPHKERLGGSVDMRENPVLFKVWSDKPSLYLRGRVKTHYTGTSWTNAHKYYKNNGAYQADHANAPSYELTVVPEAMRTRTIFAPLGMQTVDLEAHKLFTNPDGAMYYKRDSFEPPLDVYTIKGGASPTYIDDETLYLELPENYDERVKALAIELTAGYAANDDKMLALQDYLRQNYTYDLKPGLPPADMDFVSYFLNEGKGGYCTYFASALATMGRSAGVPTRYVEGVLLPQIRGTDGAYTVRADRAHAWVEAYIDGEWLIFEATPAYNAPSLQRVQVPVGQTQSTPLAEEENQSYLMDKEAMMDQAYFESDPEQTSETDRFRQYLWTGTLVTLLLCAVGSGLLITYTHQYFKRGSANRRALRLIYYLDDLLEDSHPERIPSEKLLHYMESTSENPWKNSQASYDIINWIERALYSAEVLEVHELMQLEEAVHVLERKLGKRAYRFVYCFRQRKVPN